MFSTRIARFGVRALVLAGTALTLPACATITRGTTQQFTVESSPPGASVETSNGFTCPATPCTFRMARKDKFSVTVVKDGYRSQTQQVDSAVSGGGGAALAGNLIVGGLIGIGVDATSGALNDLKPNPLIITLEPVDGAAAAAAAAPAAEAAPAAPGADQ